VLVLAYVRSAVSCCTSDADGCWWLLCLWLAGVVVLVLAPAMMHAVVNVVVLKVRYVPSAWW